MGRRERDLTEGNIALSLLIFAAPMILGNLLQQFYNITDTLIVGRFIGSGALASVGSAYTLMTFLISVITGLCMGSGALYSHDFGRGDRESLRKDVWQSFLMIGSTAVLLCAAVLLLCTQILRLQNVPDEIFAMMRTYCKIVFMGLPFIFLYNFFAYVWRAIGNSMVPLVFLGISSVINIVLDLWFVIGLNMGVAGAATATVIAQAVSGTGIALYMRWRMPELMPKRGEMTPDLPRLKRIAVNDLFTCLQQSCMNFGILMIQGLVNSFGTVIMAAFAAAVKIDTIAYMPAQEFGNAYSLFISQNHGAKRTDRIGRGTKISVAASAAFSVAASIIVFLFAEQLMKIFVNAGEIEILKAGVVYLRIEGACYVGIGCLFLLYGYFRGIGRPHVSLLLTVISLGTRVLLAYMLAPNTALGVRAIWMAIPIGWALADITGFAIMGKSENR